MPSKQAKSYETLLEALREKPLPLFESPVGSESSKLGPNVFVDEEVVNSRKGEKGELTLGRDREAEMLSWTDNKLEMAKLPR